MDLCCSMQCYCDHCLEIHKLQVMRYGEGRELKVDVSSVNAVLQGNIIEHFALVKTIRCESKTSNNIYYLLSAELPPDGETDFAENLQGNIIYEVLYGV